MPSSYSLGERYEKMMEDLIASGRFNSKSEVLRHGLRMVEESEARYLTELEELREAVRIGMESGPGIPAEEVFADVEAHLARIAAGREQDK
ncbi:type II toxin-antitoxin system ParD family antitoxin [Maricaulis sp.]|uniref:type II toxin-antitoxin system ParD family antitoxin n=1 Tax=Maricaulis sp. TaxID=1486257 RepID=UPI001B22DEF3|nr:type II toxin-antitoxin system ParD family antitoxin [Maricaulis sp.]MBO6765564.1 type II toxin-antitoxin system ParD family antitoxin [Maricaulis sp.]